MVPLLFRSATLVLAYLMKYHRMKLIDAHAYVKERRPLIRPNAGFWKDLVEFEKKLFHKNTVDMVESKIGGYWPFDPLTHTLLGMLKGHAHCFICDVISFTKKQLVMMQGGGGGISYKAFLNGNIQMNLARVTRNLLGYFLTKSIKKQKFTLPTDFYLLLKISTFLNILSVFMA